MVTTVDIAQRAQEIFHANGDTLVAGFLIRNPHVRPEDVTLVFQSVAGALRFSVEPKELYVPAPEEHGSDTDAAYIEGWNACREAMIKTTEEAHARGEQRSLKDFTDVL